MYFETNMKIQHLIPILFLAAFCTVSAQTNNAGPQTGELQSATPLWDETKPPTISLPDAYQLAITKLGQATNQFHCVRAGIYTNSNPQGVWDFAFYSTNASVKWRSINVKFDGTITELPVVYIRDASYEPNALESHETWENGPGY